MEHRWRASTVGIVVAAVVCLGCAVAVLVGADATPVPPQVQSARPQPVATPDPPASRTTERSGLPDDIAGPVLPEAAPTSVTIPSIGVASRMVTLGHDAEGSMEVPGDPALAGWYGKGPAPGALGPAVIAGHVTWNREPAVFYRLGELTSGDTIEVARSDGKTAIFSVRRVARFPKSEFPTRAVFGVIDHAGLRLITCGGSYDEASSRYLDNVVAFADLVKVHRTKTP